MKKTVLFFSLAMIVFSFCGCSAKEAIASDKQEYIVSAIGFDRENTKVKMFLETVIVNSDDLSPKKNSKLIFGTGKTVEEAFAKITAKTTQPLMFSHCGVVAIGEGITAKQLENIYDFCYEKDEINLAAMFILTPKAEKLFSLKPLSSVAMGYDIMSMTEVISEDRGINFKNLLYEIESARQKPLKTVYMPFLTADGEDFTLEGIGIFKNNILKDKMDLEETQLLGFVTDSVWRGNFLLRNNSFRVESSKTTYDFEYNGRLKIILNIRFKGKGNLKLLKEEIEKILKEKSLRGDIFSLGNFIYHQAPKQWDKFGSDYNEIFKRTEFKVNISE